MFINIKNSRQSVICSDFRTNLNDLKTSAALLLYGPYCEFRCSVVARHADVGNGAGSIADPHSA